MRRFLLLPLALLFAWTAPAQQSYWSAADEAAVSADTRLERRSMPESFSVFQLDLEGLKQRLKRAPHRSEYGTRSGIEISFPDASGQMGRFLVYEAPVMAAELQDKYPDMRSYVGIGIDDPVARIRFSVTQWGLHTMAFTGEGETVYIDPFTKDKRTYIAYTKSALANPGDFVCGVTDEESAEFDFVPTTESVMLSDGIYRTYRLAVSTTVEYSNYHINAAGLGSGTVPQKRAAVQAAIVVSVTRVNQVYETDLAVHLELIPNNDVLISIGTDSFTNDDGGTLLNENQTFLTSQIGGAAYDIGHIFSTGGGGIAALGSVCNSANKGRGVTGSPAPVGDPYNIDYVAHEMGHQFGATHTFNGLGGACTTGTRTSLTAYEPGSGSTIMAYAGICAPVNVQAFSNDHFSFASIAQVNNLVNGSANCSVNVPNGNAVPAIVPTKDYTIPYSTPFFLTAVASDANAGASLTYCWEQRDNQISTQPPTATNTNGPNFRSRTPSSSPVRYFPPLNNVMLNNLTPNYEVISSVARNYTFALTVRDNQSPNGGQTNRDDMVVTVANTGPFQVTSPSAAVTWEAGSNQTITWDVAGTTANGINTPYVNIYQGNTAGFTTLLASKVPNDGSETITVPTTTSSARIMVAGYDNIFYDLSNANHTISNPATQRFALAIAGAGEQNKAICPGSTALYTLNYSALNGFTGTTTLSATGNPSGTTVTFSPTTISATGTVTVAISNTGSAPVALHTIVVTGTSGAQTRTVNLYLDVKNPSFGPTTLQQPLNGAVNQPTDLTLNWNFDFTNASAYTVEVATDATFTNIVSAGTATTGAFNPTGLQTNTNYYWRVAPKLGDCTGSYSNTFSFTTNNVAGIDDVKALDLSIYPNPSNGTFTLQSDSLMGDKAQVTVFDLRGRAIYERTFGINGTLRETISLQDAQAGMYLLQMTDGQRRITKRILVK